MIFVVCHCLDFIGLSRCRFEGVCYVESQVVVIAKGYRNIPVFTFELYVAAKYMKIRIFACKGVGVACVEIQYVLGAHFVRAAGGEGYYKDEAKS